MKFIKNGIIYEPHNEFVIEQMKRDSGYKLYEEQPQKEPEVVKEPEVAKEVVKETKKKKK